ncbi:hypothetical protein BDV12DRAFT_57744 [Aspergillus spectabilis]
MTRTILPFFFSASVRRASIRLRQLMHHLWAGLAFLRVSSEIERQNPVISPSSLTDSWSSPMYIAQNIPFLGYSQQLGQVQPFNQTKNLHRIKVILQIIPPLLDFDSDLKLAQTDIFDTKNVRFPHCLLFAYRPLGPSLCHWATDLDLHRNISLKNGVAGEKSMASPEGILRGADAGQEAVVSCANVDRHVCQIDGCYGGQEGGGFERFWNRLPDTWEGVGRLQSPAFTSHHLVWQSQSPCRRETGPLVSGHLITLAPRFVFERLVEAAGFFCFLFLGGRRRTWRPSPAWCL